MYRQSDQENTNTILSFAVQLKSPPLLMFFSFFLLIKKLLYFVERERERGRQADRDRKKKGGTVGGLGKGY